MKTRPEHEVAYQDIIKLVAKHADKLSSVELLAIASNMLGKLIAAQDQRQLTPEEVMDIVSVNIEIGNQQALEQLKKSMGSA